MSENDIYNNFLGQVVNIGIPYYMKEHRLFFITGLVTNIDDKFLVLRVKNGIRKIFFSDIIQISINHHGETTNKTDV